MSHYVLRCSIIVSSVIEVIEAIEAIELSPRAPVIVTTSSRGEYVASIEMIMDRKIGS